MKSASPSLLHPAEDYDFLRQEALAHVQKLSSKLWTDYNVHDPGITMLEILAFAVADLGFRSGHPIGDVLTPSSPEEEAIKQFFTLAEVATSRPWTVTDYRKILIDLPEVANAWLSRSQEQEVYIYLNRTTHSFETLERPKVSPDKVVLNGLYEVAVRFEEDPDFGDLNDNSIRFWEMVEQGSLSVSTEIEIEFPFVSRLPKRLQLDSVAVDRLNVAQEDIGPIPGEPFAWYATLVLPPLPGEPTLESYEKEFRMEIRMLQPQELLEDLGSILSKLKSLSWWKRILRERYLPKLDRIADHLKTARRAMLANRNLGEDVFAVVAMDLQEVAISMDLEVKPGTDLEATETAIYTAIQQYLDPPLRFYSLGEMLEKGYSTAEIFQGPLLRNGFLDCAELGAMPKRKSVYSSDLVHLIMDIPGVVAVRGLRMQNRIAADIVADNVADSLRLTEPGRFQPTCDARRSQVRFYDGTQPMPVQADKQAVVQRFRATVQGNIPYKGIHGPEDIVQPTGKARNLAAYETVQTEFPVAWGIGRSGLPSQATAERKQKAQNLKAFLLFFEQVLAGYLAQLQHVKQLLSVSGAGQLPTYFAQVPTDIPGLKELLLDADGFEGKLHGMLEESWTATDRRNRVLDHLLARFQTSLVDQALLSWKLGTTEDAEYWIGAKTRFLQQFPGLSAHRGAGVDYGQWSEICLPLSGYQRRVFGLLGWDVPDGFRLQWQVDGTYVLKIVDAWGAELFRTVALTKELEPFAQVREIVDLLPLAERFKVEGQVLELRRINGDLLGTSKEFSTPEMEAALRKELVGTAQRLQFALKTVVVEHILLRPRGEESGTETLLTPRLSGLGSFDVTDPWSCRVSIVFPPREETPEFDKADWQREMQRMLRTELASHLLIEFYWLDALQYGDFIRDYQHWQTAQYKYEMSGISMEVARQQMNRRMNLLLNRFGASYSKVVSKKKTQYAPGEVIATVYDPDGKIVRAWLYDSDGEDHDDAWTKNYHVAGTEVAVPDVPGVKLNTKTGAVSVAPESLVAAGKQTVEIMTMNEAGGVTYHQLEVEWSEDRPATAKVLEKFDQNYHSHDLLVDIEDPDSLIVSAELVPLTPVPNGTTTFWETTGDLEITNLPAFKVAIPSPALTIDLTIKVRDSIGVEQSLRATGLAFKSPTPVRLYIDGGPVTQINESNRNLYSIQPLYSLHTIDRMEVVPGYESWGLEATIGSPSRGGKFRAADLGRFRAQAQANPNASVPVYVYIGPHRLVLYLSMNFGVDHAATLVMENLPTEAYYQNSTLIGRVTDLDNGIASFQILSSNPVNLPAGLRPNEIPGYQPMTFTLNTLLQLEIRVGSRVNFMDFVSKYFLVNSGTWGANAYFGMVIEVTDPYGGVSVVEPQIYFTSPPPVVPDTATVWVPGVLTGRLSAFNNLPVMGTLSDANGGIPVAPKVNGTTTAATWLTTTGMQLVQSGTAPYSWQLKIGNATTFGTYSKGFSLNTGKTQSTKTFTLNSVDGTGVSTVTTVMVTLQDTPASWTRNTKFDTLRGLAEVVPTSDWLFTLQDAVDGPIQTVRDAAGSTWISQGILGWGLFGQATNRLGIFNLNLFLSNYRALATVNTTIGRYELNIVVVATDEHGFEVTLTLPLYFKLDSGALWNAMHVSGNLPYYVTDQQFLSNPVLGEISDVDGGISTPPTIVIPNSTVWATTGLAFSPIGTAPNIRQQLKLANADKFKVFLQGLNPKDSVAGYANFAMEVKVFDASNQSTNLPITIQVINTRPTSAANTQVIGQLVPLGVKNTQWLFEFTDGNDLGIGGLALHTDMGSLALWGLGQDLTTVPGKGRLVVTNEGTFQSKFRSWPKDITTRTEETIYMKVNVTDLLGFTNTLTVVLELLVDQPAAFNQVVFSALLISYHQGLVIGTFSDPNNGIKTVTSSNGGTGLVFQANPLDGTQMDLVVGDPTAFRALFGADTGQDLSFVLNAVSTDFQGGATNHAITVIIKSAAKTFAPSVQGSNGLGGTLHFSDFAVGYKLGELSGGTGWTAAVASSTLNANSALRALEFVLNTSSKLEIKVKSAEFFRSMVIDGNAAVNDLWSYTLVLDVTDANNRTAQVSLPMQVLDRGAALTQSTLPVLDLCVAGTPIAMVVDSSDGGIKDYRFQSLPGTNLAENKFSIGLNAGVFEIKVGDATAFYNFVLQYFTKPTVGRMATYTMIFETRDVKDGCSRFTLTVSVDMGVGAATMQKTVTQMLPTMPANYVLGTVTVTGAYDLVGASTAMDAELALLGLKFTKTAAKTGTVAVGDLRVMSKAAFEGKYVLDPRKSVFAVEPDWLLNLSQGQTLTLSTRVSMGAGMMGDLRYYDELTLATINVDVSATSPTGLVIDLAALFPSPTSPSFSYSGLSVGTKANYTKQSTYVISLDFLSGFFSGKTSVYFSGSFYYNGQTTRRLSYKVIFNPKA